MRLHCGEVVGNNVKHGVVGLRFVVLAHEVVHAEQVGEFGLGHRDFRSLVLSHEYVIRAVEATFFEEFADEES